MRVGLKLTLAILGLLVLVLAIEGGLRLQSERELFESDLAHEQRILGKALSPSLQSALQTEGLQPALALLKRAQEGETEVQLRLVALTPGSPGEPLQLQSLAAEDRQALQAGREVSFVTRTASSGRVTTLVPLQLSGSVPGSLGPSAPSAKAEGASSEGSRVSAIELSKSLAESEARLRRAALRVLFTALIIALGAGLLAITVGERMMGQPLRRLAERARKIAAGDLSPPLPSEAQDEIGQLNRAIAKMVQGLSAARTQVEEETVARLQAERRMRQGEKLAAVGTLAAGVAHELGTPLQVILGRAKMIEKAQQDPSEVARNAQLVRQQAARMERIVRSLLDLAHPSRSASAGLSLPLLLREASALMVLESMGVGVDVELLEMPQLAVSGDEDQLNQVLINLLKNASQAMPDGGKVQLGLEGPLHLTPPRGGQPAAQGYAMIWVEDEGVGIPEDQLGKIFDPFYTTKDVGVGTGLGLSLSYQIATEHGGWLEAESVQPRGTRMKLFLPIASVDESENSHS